ncbi:MAG: SusC/RagA family TonB-linked outer membrane protein [Gemmatimonas sp.]|nr:SusC/RagA family TonB-linked outer membrane protein [Gemmatimonas sp.]
MDAPVHHSPFNLRSLSCSSSPFSLPPQDGGSGMYPPRRSSIRNPQTLAAVALLCVATPLAAQNATITGQVTDATTGQPVAAAQVFIPELDLGVLSQQNGNYAIQNVPPGSRTVSVQRIGYQAAEQAVTVGADETATLNFQITQDALQLDEIIVTGTPGGTQRRAIGNTVATVEVADVVQNVTITGMQDLLAGRTRGLQFTALNGNVGTGSPIQIRGAGSFTGSRNQPLIVVDGVRVNNSATAGPQLGESAGADGAINGQVSVLDDFNPEDIESIEIIKGPAAASLYGTEASAGVIQIITKRGGIGTPQFNVSIRQGVNYMSDPAARMGTQWTCPTDDAPGPTECPNREDLVPYNMYEEANRYIREGYFDWPTSNLYSYGQAQGYNLDVSGGSDAIRYFVSANYDEEEGYVWYNTDETYRLRGNVGVLFNEMFSLDVSTGYVDGSSRFESATIGDGGLWQDMVWSNGFFLDRITPFSSESAAPRLGGFQEHLPTDVAKTEATREYSRFTGSATLNFNSPELSLGGATASLVSRAVVGVDKGWDINRNLFPLEEGVVPEHLAEFTGTWDARYSETVAGEMTYSRPITTNLSFDYALTANLEMANRLQFATSVGAQYYISQADEFSNTGNGFASPLSRTINQLSQPQILTRYEFIENKSLGFYVQEQVSFDDRFFLTGAVRFDDNSTFGVDAPSLTYPKFSGTWVISEEGFWNVNPVNSLRLRGAWGKAGRQPDALSGFFAYQAISGPGGSPAVRPFSPGNLAIEPEVSTELELGFDIALFDDRLAGEFTHYWRRDEQQLLGIDVLPSYGYPGNVDQNLGRIDNWGWEAQLNARIYESPAFSFDLDLGADHIDNEIKELAPGTTNNNRRIGYPFPNVIVGDWVASAEWDDAAPADRAFTNAFGQRLAALCDAGISLAPEGAQDPSLYGVMPGGEALPCLTIPDRDLFAGRGFATHTFSVGPRIGLFNNQLQVFALAEGQYGRTNTDNGHSWGHIYNNSQVSRVEDDPVWVAGDRLNGSGNDWGKSIYKADFWKLREVGARYNLPASFVQRTGASRASLALSARNVWTIWQAEKDIYGLVISDPEYGDPTTLGGAGNFYSQPPLASVNATLRVTF